MIYVHKNMREVCRCRSTLVSDLQLTLRWESGVIGFGIRDKSGRLLQLQATLFDDLFYLPLLHIPPSEKCIQCTAAATGRQAG